MYKANVKTRDFSAPYFETKQGKLKPALPLSYVNGQSGVYIIRDEATKHIVYIGYSGTNLYKTLYRHFQSWEDKSQVRFTYPKTGYTVRLIFASKRRAARMEKFLIKLLRPRDNEIKYHAYEAEKDTASQKRYIEAVINMTEDDLPF